VYVSLLIRPLRISNQEERRVQSKGARVRLASCLLAIGMSVPSMVRFRTVPQCFGPRERVGCHLSVPSPAPLVR
jgi:hypothetical protein